mmetsp:Transcript_28852/g.93186  ORF Transcript_28852/g.93186 Transcript_28852/m.93186 type:complete len:234 (-) Transcript_28852:643-1344(-)
MHGVLVLWSSFSRCGIDRGCRSTHWLEGLSLRIPDVVGVAAGGRPVQTGPGIKPEATRRAVIATARRVEHEAARECRVVRLLSHAVGGRRGALAGTGTTIAVARTGPRHACESLARLGIHLKLASSKQPIRRLGEDVKIALFPGHRTGSRHVRAPTRRRALRLPLARPLLAVKPSKLRQSPQRCRNGLARLEQAHHPAGQRRHVGRLLLLLADLGHLRRHQPPPLDHLVVGLL